MLYNNKNLYVIYNKCAKRHFLKKPRCDLTCYIALAPPKIQNIASWWEEFIWIDFNHSSCQWARRGHLTTQLMSSQRWRAQTLTVNLCYQELEAVRVDRRQWTKGRLSCSPPVCPSSFDQLVGGAPWYDVRLVGLETQKSRLRTLHLARSGHVTTRSTRMFPLLARRSSCSPGAESNLC